MIQKKDPFGRGIDLYEGIMKKGRIDKNNDIYNSYGKRIGEYIGGGMAKNSQGIKYTMENLFKFFG